MRRLALALLLTAACTPTSKGGIGSDGTAAASSGALASGVTPREASPTGGGGRVQIMTAAEESDAISLIRTERLKAKADGRLLVVYVGATWCDPCKKFKQELDSGRLDDRLGKVTLLAFDADKDIDRLGAAGYAFKFVPFVALPGADGRPADTQEATGKGGQAWRELLGKLDAWQREALPRP